MPHRFDGNAARAIVFDSPLEGRALVEPLDEMAAKRAAKKSGAKKGGKPPERKKPGGGLTDMGALRRVNPDEWAAKIREAMKASGGRVSDAAMALGVARNTLFGWLADDRFVDVERAPAGRPWPQSE